MPIIEKNNDITEEEWEKLQAGEGVDALVVRSDGSILVIAGIWSTWKRGYAYSIVEIAGTPAWQSPVAVKIASAKGPDVEEYRSHCHADFDRKTGKTSRIEVFLIPPHVPVRIKEGYTDFSSGGNPTGQSHVYFFGGPESSAAYRSQSSAYVRSAAEKLKELKSVPAHSTQRTREHAINSYTLEL